MLTAKDASKYLNVAMGTLSNSRNSGTLLGIKAPKHTKHAGKVLYDKCYLDNWFKELGNKSKHSLGNKSITESKMRFNDVEWIYASEVIEPGLEINQSTYALVVAKCERFSPSGEIERRLFRPFLCLYKNGINWDELGEKWLPVKFTFLSHDFLMSGVDIMESAEELTRDYSKEFINLKKKLAILESDFLDLELPQTSKKISLLKEQLEALKKLINANNG